MRKGIEIEIAAADRARLEAIVAERNRRQKHVERARIVLLSAAGVGTLALMRAVGCAKATVWRWQERFMAAIVSLATLMFGSALAAVAERHPAYVAMLERGAGALMVAGLVLLGSSLPFIP